MAESAFELLNRQSAAVSQNGAGGAAMLNVVFSFLNINQSHGADGLGRMGAGGFTDKMIVKHNSKQKPPAVDKLKDNLWEGLVAASKDIRIEGPRIEGIQIGGSPAGGGGGGGVKPSYTPNNNGGGSNSLA